MNELHLFAGAGGGILGGILCGNTCICAVEIEHYCRKVLLQRQRDGILPKFPIWDDIRTFDGTPWRGNVDIVCGGFPCQDISAAGKGAGITGTRSGLWEEMARVVGEVQPRFVLIENSPMLRTRGLCKVLKDLAEMGYNAEWGVVGARHAGAPHKRDRMWILADSNKECERGLQKRTQTEISCIRDDSKNVSDTDSVRKLQPERCQCHQRGRAGDCRSDVSHADNQWAGWRQQQSEGGEEARRTTAEWWITEPDVGRVAHGVAARVDRLKAIGNGQVPEVVRLAFNTLSERR